MQLTKKELSEVLNELNIPVSDSMIHDKNNNTTPRVVFWDYVWENIAASATSYGQNVTYQVSFFASKPRDSKLLELLTLLKKRGIDVVVSHEHDIETRTIHSFFSIEVIEDVY